MDPEEVILNALARLKGTQDVIDKGSSAVQQYYCGATVLITGGSGFLGKQLIEKLFRSCKITKVFMLMRPKKGKPVDARLGDILKETLYDTLRKEQPGFAEKIVPIAGDIAEIDLGISEKDRQAITNEVDVIFHVAATVSFQEPLRSATLANVRGTRELIKLAKHCKKLRSIVYVSTAFAHATLSRSGTEILEQFYKSPVPPLLMIELAETMDEERLNNVKDGLITDWPNTYTFTKALAEDLLRTTAGELPISIIRPTIVVSARREPYAGWIDKNSVFGASGIILGCIMGVIHALQANPDIRVDFIPVDYVNSLAIVAGAAGRKDGRVYTIGTSCRNHMTWGKLTYILDNARETVVSPQAIWYCFVVETTNKWVYLFLSYLFEHIPANLVDGLCMILNKPPKLKKIYAFINKMATVTSFYMNNSWIFHDDNTLKLYNSLSEDDKTIYHFDVADIEWKEQIILCGVGLRKYIVKDGLKNTGMMKQFCFKMATYILGGTFIFFLWVLLCYLFIFVRSVFNI